MNTLSMTTIQCGSELILCYGIVSVVYGRIHLKSLKNRYANVLKNGLQKRKAICRTPAGFTCEGQVKWLCINSFSFLMERSQVSLCQL